MATVLRRTGSSDDRNERRQGALPVTITGEDPSFSAVGATWSNYIGTFARAHGGEWGTISTVSGGITVPWDGLYRMTLSQRLSCPTGIRTMVLGIARNTTSEIYPGGTTVYVTSNIATQWSGDVHAVIDCNRGDFLYPVIFSANHGSLAALIYSTMIVDYLG